MAVSLTGKKTIDKKHLGIKDLSFYRYKQSWTYMTQKQYLYQGILKQEFSVCKKERSNDILKLFFLISLLKS